MAGVARLETGVSGSSGNCPGGVRSDTEDSKNVDKIGM